MKELLTPPRSADDEPIRHAGARRSSFDVTHLACCVDLEIRPMRSDGLSLTGAARAVATPPSPCPEETVRIASADDVVLERSPRYRPDGETSERRRLGVLKVPRPTLDRACTARRTAAIGVADLRFRAREGAGYPD